MRCVSSAMVAWLTHVRVYGASAVALSVYAAEAWSFTSEVRLVSPCAEKETQGVFPAFSRLHG